MITPGGLDGIPSLAKMAESFKLGTELLGAGGRSRGFDGWILATWCPRRSLSNEVSALDPELPSESPSTAPSTLKTLRFVLIVLVITLGLSALAAWFFLHSSQSGPEVVTAAPSFELVDETGAKFGDQDLRGQAYVVQFFFTSCTTVCPRITDWMTQIQDRTKSLGDRIRLVSISVDPRHDTPEKLRVYAKGYGAIPGHWKFLTGDLSAVEHVVVDGFFQVMERDPDQKTGLYSIAHSERLILVDQKNRVRGYYETNEEGINKLIRDLNAVVKEQS